MFSDFLDSRAVLRNDPRNNIVDNTIAYSNAAKKTADKYYDSPANYGNSLSEMVEKSNQYLDNRGKAVLPKRLQK
jgi:hypothetical protein